jgi:hypothetical protein
MKIKSFVSIDTPAQKPERSDSIQFPEEVIVFTLESNDNECPGMLPEEKVSHFI